MAEEQREQEQQIEENGSAKKLIILLIIVLLLLAIAGGVAFYFIKFKKEKELPPPINATKNATVQAPKPPPELEELAKPGIFINVGSFVVNLADTDVQRFVKVSVVIEVVNEQVQNEVENYMPAIRDAIVDLLSSKYYKDIRTPEGRERLKIELLKRLNSLIPGGGIKAVYFTSFVVQTM